MFSMSMVEPRPYSLTHNEKGSKCSHLYIHYIRYVMYIEDYKITELEYLGNGSYGVVYVIPGHYGGYVIKEHAIVDVSLCENASWTHEFEIHTTMYNKCNGPLQSLDIDIVRPYEFAYCFRDQTVLKKLPTSSGANSCIILMDRIYGRDTIGSNEIMEKKLSQICEPTRKYVVQQKIPPYMFLGTIGDVGRFTLEMLAGSSLIDFGVETAAHCIIAEGIGLQILLNMMMSFFIVLEAGFMPRDIEYVLNGNVPDILITMLDFNEVKTVEERRQIYGENYNKAIDAAYVYINLCGLAKTACPNPYAPYEAPTPQWKFLCSPLKSPQAFLEIACKLLKVYDCEETLRFILDYTVKNHMKEAGKSPWTPNNTHYSRDCVGAHDFCMEFDMKYQSYIVGTMVSLLKRRDITIGDLTGMTYDDVFNYLEELINQKKTLIEEDDWPEPWSA